MIRKSLLLMDDLDEGGGISLELGNLFWNLSNNFFKDKNGLLQTCILMIIHKYAIRSIYDERGGRGFPAPLEILDKSIGCCHFRCSTRKSCPYN